MTDDFGKYKDLLPEGATPVVGLALVYYIDEDGRGATNWHLDGESTRMEVTGLIEVVKFDVLRSYLADLVEHSQDEEG